MSTEPLTPEQIEELKKRHIRSFCMRRGHISNAQEKALEELLPLYEIPYDANQMFDAVKTFENNNPLVLEIGCGMGETTAAIAQAHPEINFIGCEVFAAGVGALSKRLHDMNLKNVRIFRHDAVEVVRDMLEDNSIDGVHIFFPDPWRKARHHKRRLINESFLKLLVPKMKKDAYFHCATDWENYAEQMLEVLSAEPTLENLHEGAAPQPENPLIKRPTTKFNERGNRLGHGCWDFVFRKI